MGATLHRGARASHYRGLSRCGAQAPDAQAQQLWLTGLVAPRHVGSSQTRARTRVPCIGRQILNHCATREALCCLLNEGFVVGLVIAFLHYNSYTTHLKYTTLWFLVYSQGCTTFITINFRPFSSPKEEILFFSAVTPHFPHLL